MATKKTTYFAKAVLVDGDKVYSVGEEIKLTDAQAKRLEEADAVTKEESEVNETGAPNPNTDSK
jgi:hypothetical protein